MSKRITVFLVLISLVFCALSAYSNEQRIISAGGEEYKAMETLYILSGKSLPSSSGPWSEGEMALMLEYIDYNSLSEKAKRYYDYVKSLVVSDPVIKTDDNLALDFSLGVNLEGYLHTDTVNTVDEDDWFHGYISRKPFLSGAFEVWPGDHYYGYLEMTLLNSYGINVGKKDEDNLLYKNIFNINIPILNAVLFSLDGGEINKDHDMTTPYKALGAVGGRNWNLVAGSDKLSWGSGETGNMMLSSSFPKQTFIRFNTFFRDFKYSLLYSLYPGPDYSKENDDLYHIKNYKVLIVHRFEVNLFNNKVGLAINEACMYWSTDKYPFNLLHINPFSFMHNAYVATNGNSLMVFEADYTPIKGLNIYGQLAIDEISAIGEGRENPAAMGFIIGAKGAMTLSDGILTGSFEAVKTDPFLFIRGLYNNKDERTGYGYDAILRIVSGGNITLQNKFVTYTYGNDVILFDARVKYTLPEKFKVGFETMLMYHGSMNAESNWGNYAGEYVNAPDIKTPTTFNPFNPDDYDASSNKVLTSHPVERSLIFSLTGEYYITPSFSIYGVVDTLLVKNKGNKSVDSTDFQFTFGLSYSL